MIDFMTICARKKLGKPDWQWATSERVEGGFLLTGGVPGVYKSGAKKGRPKWPKKSERDRVIFRSRSRTQRSQRRGLLVSRCAWCEGSGKSPFRATLDGTEYKPCRKCDGTGKAS